MGTSNRTLAGNRHISTFDKMADKVLEEVTKMDRSSMNKVQTEEKTVLPDAEAIRQEKAHEDFKAGIASFDKKAGLKKAETIEKNSLPTKDDIAAEKAAQ